MKKFVSALVILFVLAQGLTGCGKTKIVHCDRCGKEVVLDANSNIEEDWIIFCSECEEEAFGDNPVVS